MSTLEQRRAPRYRLELPLRILKLGERPVNSNVQTRDISTGGVSFNCDKALDVGGAVEYEITLSQGEPPVRIHCLGRVVRSVAKGTLPLPFEVAVTMERYQFVGSEGSEQFAAAS